LNDKGDANLVREQRQAALAELTPQLKQPENLAKYDALMEYVVTQVRQMIKEEGNGQPPKESRGPNK
jgi:hypothetical protein